MRRACSGRSSGSRTGGMATLHLVVPATHRRGSADREHRAPPRPALHRDGSAVRLGDPLGDREAQAGARAARRCASGPGRPARTARRCAAGRRARCRCRVAHGEADRPSSCSGGETSTVPPCGRVLDRVGHQVEQHLADPVPVHRQPHRRAPAWCCVTLIPDALAQHPRGLGHVAQQVPQVAIPPPRAAPGPRPRAPASAGSPPSPSSR